MSEATMSSDDEEWDMQAARERLKPKLDGSKKGRQSRQRKISQAVNPIAKDGRSLRASGRTAQFNFKALPGLREAAQKAAEREGITLAEWMENAVKAALGEGGF